MRKKCILIEWYNHLEEGDNYSTTFELFEDIVKAYDFAKKVKIRRFDLVIANNLYYEDGELNYEDKDNTIEESYVFKDNSE